MKNVHITDNQTLYNYSISSLRMNREKENEYRIFSIMDSNIDKNNFRSARQINYPISANVSFYIVLFTIII